MGTLAQRKMTVDEFLAWAEGREGHWELHDGVPVLTSPRSVGYCEVKGAVYLALHRSSRQCVEPCHLLGSGIGIRISRYGMYLPDALVYCGPRLPNDAIEVPNPVILVEVLTPARKMDSAVRLNGYLGLPSVRQFLIIDPHGPPVVHYSRQVDGTTLRSVLDKGTLRLSPPGIEVAVAEMFSAPSVGGFQASR